MKRIMAVWFAVWIVMSANAQDALKKVYNEEINPIEQIDKALVEAKAGGKHVVCQVGGNWCIWCLRFADFITKDEAISKMVNDNFFFIHVNYNPRKPGRIGFPVLVILDADGKVLHIQDSSFLEEGQSYSAKKVLRFFKNWTPAALKS